MRSRPTSRRSRRRTRAAVVGAYLCLASVIAMQIAGYLWWNGRFSELLAGALLLAAVALVLVWLRRTWRLGRAETVRRIPEGERRSAETAALRLLRRRAIVARGMVYLGACASFALAAGTFADDPAWRELVEGDPAISAVAISSISEVRETNGRGGRKYDFAFTGTVPTSTSIYIVHGEATSKSDPGGRDDWRGLAWAVYDPDRVQLSGDLIIVDTYGEAVQATRLPLDPVVGLGWYLLVLLIAAAFSRKPSKWVAEVSRSNRLAYYRGHVYRLRGGDLKSLGGLVLLGAFVYLGCVFRLAPTFGGPVELFHTATAGAAVYGLLMLPVVLSLGHVLASAAIGDARLPD